MKRIAWTATVALVSALALAAQHLAEAGGVADTSLLLTATR